MLQACLNGGRDEGFHAATPLTPRELAADARAVVEAGAQQLHIHSRDAAGRESLHPDDTASALEAIRAGVPGIAVGVSLRLGLDSRIGLEDGKLLPSGAEAENNAALIRAARALTG
jgi:uncharacterized protein (DUF849 family)